MSQTFQDAMDVDPTFIQLYVICKDTGQANTLLGLGDFNDTSYFYVVPNTWNPGVYILRAVGYAEGTSNIVQSAIAIFKVQ